MLLSIYESVLKETLNPNPVLPRQRKVPRRLDSGTTSHEFQSPKEYFRQRYFEMLDIVTNEINRQRDFLVASDFEQMIIAAPESVRTT